MRKGLGREPFLSGSFGGLGIYSIYILLYILLVCTYGRRRAGTRLKLSGNSFVGWLGVVGPFQPHSPLRLWCAPLGEQLDGAGSKRDLLAWGGARPHETQTLKSRCK